MPEALLQGKGSRNRKLWSPEPTPRPVTASGRSAEEQQPGGHAVAWPAQVAAALDLADIRWGLQWPTPAAWVAALALLPPKSRQTCSPSSGSSLSHSGLGWYCPCTPTGQRQILDSWGGLGKRPLPPGRPADGSMGGSHRRCSLGRWCLLGRRCEPDSLLKRLGETDFRT